MTMPWLSPIVICFANSIDPHCRFFKKYDRKSKRINALNGFECNPFHEHKKPVNQQLNVQVVSAKFFCRTMIYNTVMKVYQQL